MVLCFRQAAGNYLQPRNPRNFRIMALGRSVIKVLSKRVGETGKPLVFLHFSAFLIYSHSVLNISSPIKMSVIGILYGGYSFRYQSDFARKTFLCTRRVPQNQVSHSYQYLLATEEQPCFSIGYMNIILQKAQKSIVCCLSGAVPFGSAPLFLFQG